MPPTFDRLEPMSESQRRYQPPVIIIAEGNDVALYSSLEDAESKLEGIDVDDGVYVGFDSAGRALALRAEGVRRSRRWVDIGTVHISVAQDVATHQEELSALLRSYLDAVGRTAKPDAKLHELVEECRLVNEYRG